MKKIIYHITICAVFMAAGNSCTRKLEEENHSKLTESFFSTSDGIDKGVNAVYAGLRELYGPEEGLEAFTVVGTDEFRIANGNRTTNVANYNSSYTPANEFSARVWNSSYKYINTCNGLVDFGENITGLTDVQKKAKIAEAKFLRAFLYFKLAQFFGDVTLNTHYSNSPNTAAERNKIADVYNFIIDDLKTCITDLTPSPQQNGVLPGKASAAAARHLLALVYLTRGWSPSAQTDDFQNAFDMAKGLIDAAPSLGLGLLDNYGDVHKPLNENNREVLFNVQYSKDLTYGGNHSWNHLYVDLYPNQLGERNVNDGRSYGWYRATKWLYDTAFADKVNDIRYFKTFQSVWIATKPLSGTYTVNVGGTNYTLNYNFQKGDTAMYMPGFNMPASQMQNRKYYIYTPETYTNSTIYPTMTKYLDPNRDVPNENSHRSIIVFRLAETYLVAAEAALKLGRPADAATYINAIRRRAAVPGHQLQMEITPADVTIDYILDERTRELCAENIRWLDLVRTDKLLERVKKHDDWEARNNIQEFHKLRPIPQSQIDAIITGTPYPQNMGWK
ncbi:hypothetical protein A3860_21755 [Niastella vici]|uniref:Carbohydrate-binding protein SusD n=1 Tax=Niastella vici TaxID=1703345 RepID=A0A1V9G0F0_9BACT|nr:RagB/SusD family nutrient uptake outer membrane protein [Niastella vici]OQP64044.1 hypothetical protein A3860_21755 [Niastella vici]